MPDAGPPPRGETLEQLRTELDRLYTEQTAQAERAARTTARALWRRLPQPAKVTSVALAALLAVGALTLPAAAAAAYQQRFETDHGPALQAIGLAEAKADAEAYNASLAGFTLDLKGFADEATSKRLFDARNALAQAIQNDDLGAIERARARVAERVDEVAEATAAAQERRSAADPLADPASKDALTAGIAAVREAIAGEGDVLASLIALKAAGRAAAADASGGSRGDGAAEPAPAAEPARPAPVRVQAEGNHRPGCSSGPHIPYTSYDPGPSGTSVIRLSEPYDYTIEGQTVHVALCTAW